MVSVGLLFEIFLSKLHTERLKRKRNLSIGKGTYIYRKSIISCKKGAIFVGNNCRLGCSPRVYHAGMPFFTKLLCDTEKAQIIIGNNCRLNGVYVHAQDSVTIGNDCVLASDISIIDSNGHCVNSLNRTIGRDNPKGIKIGNNVWIGLNSIVLKGTIIGDNSVIAAGSVVRGFVPENTVYDTNGNVTLRKIVIKD